MLRDGGVAGLAHIRGGLWRSFVPAQLLEPQPLPMTAVRARYEVAALVTCVVFTLDRARPRDRRGRDDEDLAACKGSGARLGQRDRVAFAFNVQRKTIYLVQE